MNYYRQDLFNDRAEEFYIYQSSGEIFELIVAFENCTLPRERWTYSAYLTIVFWYLYMNPAAEAHRLICAGIRRYNFEHNIITTPSGTDCEIFKLKEEMRAVNDYLKQHKEADSFVNLANGLFRYLSDVKKGENTPKQSFDIANSKRAGSNKYEFTGIWSDG